MVNNIRYQIKILIQGSQEKQLKQCKKCIYLFQYKANFLRKYSYIGTNNQEIKIASKKILLLNQKQIKTILNQYFQLKKLEISILKIVLFQLLERKIITQRTPQTAEKVILKLQSTSFLILFCVFLMLIFVNYEHFYVLLTNPKDQIIQFFSKYSSILILGKPNLLLVSIHFIKFCFSYQKAIISQELLCHLAKLFINNNEKDFHFFFYQEIRCIIIQMHTRMLAFFYNANLLLKCQNRSYIQLLCRQQKFQVKIVSNKVFTLASKFPMMNSNHLKKLLSCHPIATKSYHIPC
ncbi:transmembrane protein, putative (macronuclear) [Tetrahymena thermophila SB210]|uniref:Transmembrane protein, putative n=1 Tax=Tetrahymena thermophila (strain SB210) TaxID=312017 RepID=W7X3X3_TETTS|nr:transmembrane protein, putative [Tetrahymena thermophila SB210]EWS71128.1 transmembrane protein, putative [Tetrahymena thermophila SB210]|eukprot:XP_012656336.1 transmembrane protein, putative [Tetrahymena thermophila SB210]